VRKSDLELLEMHLTPHGAAIDRLTVDVGEAKRASKEAVERLKDLERDRDAHKTDIAQGLASIRSLLQRANRVARQTEIIEDDEVVDEPEPEVNTLRTADQIVADARARNPGRSIL